MDDPNVDVGNTDAEAATNTNRKIAGLEIHYWCHLTRWSKRW